jgi:hypothetical protein
MVFTYPNSTQYIFPIPGGGGGNPLEVELRTISAPEDAAKQLTLTSTPLDGAKVILAIQGAPSQINGLDFSVTGTTLSWSGLGLDGILAAGDEIYIQYSI